MYFDADAAVAGDPHMLQVTVIDEGQELSVVDRGEQDQPAIEAGPHAIFFLRGDAVVLRLVDDVGLHPDGEIAGGGAALHGAPLIVLGRIAGRNPDVDARRHTAVLAELQIGFLQRRQVVSMVSTLATSSLLMISVILSLVRLSYRS